MIQHHEGPQGFVIAVSVSAPRPPGGLSRFHRFVMALGSPERIILLCNAVNIACCGVAVGYILTWIFWLQGVVRDTLHPTVGQSMFLALAWAPFVALQLFTGAVRLAVLMLQMKSAQMAADATNQQFAEFVGQAVTETMDRYMATRPPPEKHTLQ